MPLTKEKRLTTTYYKLLPEGAPYQLIEGELIITPAPNPRHQIISANIFEKVRVLTKGLGVCLYSPVDVYLDDENAFQPDVVFISNNRRDIIKEDGIYGVPDLVIEILSPSTASYDLKEKFGVYERSGVKEYWIVDPEVNSVEVYFNEHGRFSLIQKAERTGNVKSLILKDVEIALYEIFSEL